MAKTATKTNLVPQSILDAAAKLFLEHGFGGTTMEKIAAELGVTRTAVYYYFKNKDEILASLTEGVTLAANARAAPLAEGSGDPVAALRALVTQHATLILAHPLQFRVVEHNESFLDPAQREVAERARHTLLDHFTGVIGRGVQSGHFRPVEARLAALSIIGMCNWAAWWFKPDGRRSVDEVAQHIADLALHAVLHDEGRRAHGADVHDSLQVIEQELAFIRQRLPRSA